MKQVLTVVTMLLLIAGIAYAKNYEISKKTGEYDVKVEIDNDPLAVGDNNVLIVITDASGHQVIDAKVELYYLMPSMPAMNYTTAAKIEGNRYKATVKPTMGGDWSLDLKFTRPGEKIHKVTLDFKAE